MLIKYLFDLFFVFSLKICHKFDGKKKKKCSSLVIIHRFKYLSCKSNFNIFNLNLQRSEYFQYV